MYTDHLEENYLYDHFQTQKSIRRRVHLRSTEISSLVTTQVMARDARYKRTSLLELSSTPIREFYRLFALYVVLSQAFVRAPNLGHIQAQ